MLLGKALIGRAGYLPRFSPTGEAGIGKTSLLRWIARALRGAGHLVISRYRPGLSFGELVSAICCALRIEATSGDPEELLRRIHEALVERKRSRSGVVLLIDDARHLGGEVLRNLVRLTVPPSSSRRALRIVIRLASAGDRRAPRTPALMDLKAMLVLHLRMQPLSDADICKLILHRLRRGGGRPEEWVSDGAIEAIARWAQGIPRRAVLLSAEVLRRALVSGGSTWSVQLVESASRECQSARKVGSDSISMQVMGFRRHREDEL